MTLGHASQAQAVPSWTSGRGQALRNQSSQSPANRGARELFLLWGGGW